MPDRRKTHKSFTINITNFLLLSFTSLFLFQCSPKQESVFELKKNSSIVFLGNNLCSRAIHFGHLETQIHLAYPDSNLVIRNMCDGGNRPGFRPHSGRKTPWPFPGAEAFQSELAEPSGSEGHLEYPDEWLTRHKADAILAFFGYNESFAGEAGLDNFKAELNAFVEHTLNQQYNGQSAPQLALVSPIAFEDLSDQFDLPDGIQENQNLGLYSQAISAVASQHQLPFIDAFNSSKKWYTQKDALTNDGFQLNDQGYQLLAQLIQEKLFGKLSSKAQQHQGLVKEAVLEKNWFWHNDFKIPNGVHVFGRRYEPFGPDNYPPELKKIRELTIIRDQNIWAVLDGKRMNLDSADQQTTVLPPVETNFEPSYKNGDPEYLYGQDALDRIYVAPGYKIELFASEKEFPDLANPVQLSFDNRGRLWVATMPTYPHYKPGDSRPNDKLIILEDTDGDGKADEQKIFADNLHLPVGFEFSPEGVYVSQGTNLVLLKDNDGDDKADEKEIILSGFDDHDTHHVISAFCADPAGAIYMAEGVFLHTNVETAYGPVRATNGGFYRYNPVRRHLERTAQLSIPNPWGIAFDEWGQNLFAETSGPDVLWMLPGSIKSRYGVANPKGPNIIENDHRVRPTSGLEFVSSRHFPDEAQGDLLINNTIGFLGTKQHQMLDEGPGFKSQHRQDLLWSDDPNFRPVDMEFAPDGSLYLVDWHNVLIGHMQHNARDPLRDHVHGRIYRITYPSRPLVQAAKVADASIAELLDNLKLPEYRTRYRSRRELRARDQAEVLKGLSSWVAQLYKDSEDYEHHLLEALWVSWGLNAVDEQLLGQLLSAENFKARAAAVRVLRYSGHQISDQLELLKTAALDNHPRVRMEALVAASWLEKKDGLEILAEVGKLPLPNYMLDTYRTAEAHLNGHKLERNEKPPEPEHLSGEALTLYQKGSAIYEKEAYCGTCHQSDGKGLQSVGYPPLAGTKWVLEDKERLIKLTLKGLYGPIEVLSKSYDPQVPMTAYEGLMNDEEVAAVLTFVRNSFGNQAAMVSAAEVAAVRKAIKDKEGFYKPAELLNEHPHLQ